MNDKPQPPKAAPKNLHYQSYLLRLWREEEAQGSDWRASLEAPETGLRIGFSNLEQLFDYLMDSCEGNGEKQNIEGS